MVVVAKENGIEIYCDEDGKFSAYAFGQHFEDRSLSKVKKWTVGVLPTVALLQLEESSYGGRSGARMVESVASVARDAKGAIYGSGPTNPDSRSRYANYPTTYRNLHEPDEVVIVRMRALNERYAAWQKEIDERYAAAFAEIKAALVPITEERFAELKAAKVAEAKR